MHTADEAAQPAQHFGIVEFGAVPRTARVDGHAKQRIAFEPGAQRRRLADATQVGNWCIGLLLQHQRRDHRNLLLLQLQREAVFVEDLRVAPACRAVELRHHRGAVFQHHLEHAVLVGVELQHAAVAALSHALQRVEHALRRQAFVRVGSNHDAPRLKAR
jgi:hypothetical protein